MGKNREAVESQYMSVVYLDLDDPGEENLKNSLQDPVKFYATLRKHVGADGEFNYRDLADYCLTLHSLPISNTFVERVFSLVSYSKTKWTNRIALDQLEALIRVKSHLKSRDQCCTDIEVSSRMLKKHTSSMYDFKTSRPEIDVNFESLCNDLA